MTHGLGRLIAFLLKLHFRLMLSLLDLLAIFLLFLWAHFLHIFLDLFLILVIVGLLWNLNNFLRRDVLINLRAARLLLSLFFIFLRLLLFLLLYLFIFLSVELFFLLRTIVGVEGGIFFLSEVHARAN